MPASTKVEGIDSFAARVSVLFHWTVYGTWPIRTADAPMDRVRGRSAEDIARGEKRLSAGWRRTG
jgi:hypothetical protein